MNGQFWLGVGTLGVGWILVWAGADVSLWSWQGAVIFVGGQLVIFGACVIAESV